MSLLFWILDFNLSTWNHLDIGIIQQSNQLIKKMKLILKMIVLLLLLFYLLIIVHEKMIQGLLAEHTHVINISKPQSNKIFHQKWN